MKSANLRALVVSLLIASSFPARTAGELTVVPSSPASATASSSGTTAEIALLRSQLADAQRFQEQVLSTVYWSLGTLGGVALLLVGFGWFTNFRVYERDRLALERELRGQLIEEVSKAKAEATQTATSRFADQDQSLAASVAAAETRISTATSAIVANTVKEFNLKHSALASAANDLKREVRELQLASEIRERMVDRANGSLRNALQSAVTALELANKIESEYSVGEVLDLISEDIADILKGNQRPIDNYLVGQLVTALDAVKGQHAHAAAALKAQGAKLLTA